MANNVDIRIQKKNKYKMQKIKENERINFSEQINYVLTRYALFPVEHLALVIENYYPTKPQNTTTVTIHKSKINIEHFERMHYLLKAKYPYLTFKDMLFYIFEDYFDNE